MTKDDIFNKIKTILSEEFEVPAEDITPDALLNEQLELDSIDAIDLVVKLKNFIPTKIDPEIFSSVRTIQDVVDKLYPYAQNIENS